MPQSQKHKDRRTSHIPAEEVDATNKLSREVVRRDGLLMLVAQVKLPLTDEVFPDGVFAFNSGELVWSCVKVLRILLLHGETEAFTATLLEFPPLPI